MLRNLLGSDNNVKLLIMLPYYINFTSSLSAIGVFYSRYADSILAIL